MSKKRLISLLLAMILLFSSMIPISSAFAAEAVKYHPDDWFGYTHSQEEIVEWIRDAVKVPTTSEDAVNALKGEIRPGDVLSFQVEVEMPTGHEEVIQFMKDFSFNMIFPYGTNAMIEVYASDAPLLTDEEYQERISEFNNQIDELEQLLNDEELLKDIENDVEAKSLYITYKDMVENRDKYYDIYLNQLETARTKYGFADDSYGTVYTWMGAFENNPNSNISLENGDTYESYRSRFEEGLWVAPIITEEEYEQAVAEFDEMYPAIIEEYMSMFEEAVNSEDISESDLELIEIAKESIHDGTFYNTIIKYIQDCRDGYSSNASDYVAKVIALIFSQLDYLNAYSEEYHFRFPDRIVQRNQPCSYIFDINIVATDALSVGGYLTLPSLNWHYEEACPSQYLVNDGSFKFHWEQYYTCNSRSNSLFKLGNTYYVNDSFMYNDETLDLDNIMNKDKRRLAFDFIESEFGDSDYKNSFYMIYLDELMRDNVLKAIRPITVECRDEYGNLIKSETVETYDAYYDITPEEIYDYQLVGPENIKGVIKNEDTTVTFNYEHKDVELKVSYVDFNGNELIPAGQLTGKTLDEYQAVPAEIPGYNLIVVPKNASGVLHEDSTDIQFVYKIKPASVSVNYLDTEGNKIAQSEIIYGTVFEEYNAVPKEIAGYELVEIPENASGKMEENIINVNYIYKILNS